MDTLIISCCAPKLERPAPAIELYQNRVFNLIRNTPDLDQRFQVFILSALYGLVPAHQMLEPYDQMMDDDRVRELTDCSVAPLWLRESPGRVFVYGGERYRHVVKDWSTKMRRRLVIEVVGRNRGNGDHFSELKRITA